MKYFRLALLELKPGMILAKNIFSDKQLILKKETVLTDAFISLLKLWNIPLVDVFCTKNKNISYAEFEDFHTSTVEVLTEIINKARLFKTLSITGLNEIVKTSEHIITCEKGILAYLAMIKNTDDSIYRHSVTVGILAGLIGKWVGHSNLQELILAGFLHDIGKTQVSLQLLNKPGKLNADEWEIIRRHPYLGIKLLKLTACLSEQVLKGIYQHHERMDGSGYPDGLRDREIAIDAKIISIADVYDAMTSNRAYRVAETPFRAIEEMHGEMFDKLDPKLCNTFISHAKESFIGMSVRLSDGSEATVVGIDKTTLIKPILRCDKGSYINLTQRNDLTIVDVT
jgi:putative nucleotidyltransferase with HDIG domain